LIVGVLRETEPGERRVALVPDGVKVLVKAGLDVRVGRGRDPRGRRRDPQDPAAERRRDRLVPVR
jgi:NAD/NADP transhydrogenase alpha subunit